MRLLILLLTLSASAAPWPFRCDGCERNPRGAIKRSRTLPKSFLQAVGWDLPTTHIRVDHIRALACGAAGATGEGAVGDVLGNLQIQWKNSAAAIAAGDPPTYNAQEKDRWERTPAACSPDTWTIEFAHRAQAPPSHDPSIVASWAYAEAQRMKAAYLANRHKLPRSLRSRFAFWRRPR